MKGSLRFTQLDGRFKGHDIFKWMVTATYMPEYQRFSPMPLAQSDLSKIIDFNKLRDWCWDTYGPSCDMKDYDFIHEVSLAQHNDNGGNLNEYWCWSNENYLDTPHKKTDRRIYLATDKERTWLETRWR